MLKIVTDGATDMPQGWEKDFEIDVIPLKIRFGEETYLQGVDVTNQTFYGLVNSKKQIPQTSLPSPYQIAEFYRRIANKDDTILSIHISSKLSGTFATVQMAVKEIGREFRVIPIDSLAGSAAVGFMCRQARIMDRAGQSINQILKCIEDMKKKLVVIFTLENLEFARMNGRVSALQSVLSSMLRINPIVVLREGMLTIGEKVRTRQRALQKVIEVVKEKVGNHKVMLAVVHAADAEGARRLSEQLKQVFNIQEIILTDLAIPVAANLGPGTIGIVAIPVDQGE